MRNFKAVLILLLCAGLIFCTALQSAAYQYIDYTYSPDRSQIFSDDSGVFITYIDGNQLMIEKVAPECFSRTLTLPYPVYSCLIAQNTASAICSDTLNHQIVIYYYDISCDILDSFSLSQNSGKTDIGYAMDHNGVYLCDSNRPNIVNRYSFSGKQEYYYELPSSVSCITQDQSGNVYAVSNNTLYRLDPNAVTSFSGSSVYHYVHFLSDDRLIDNAGIVYMLSSGIKRLFDSQGAGCFGGTIGSDIYLAKDDMVTRYTDGVLSDCCRLDGSVIYLCVIDQSVWVFTNENGVRASCLSNEDFSPVNYSDNDNNESNSADGSSASTYGITSDLYRIDYDNGVIYNIPSGTTIAGFKEHMSYDEYSLTFYQDGATRYSGNLSTAMKADFSSDAVASFALSVSGELTGEGNVNSKDRNALMDYLLGSWNFSGAYLYAADLNCDGEINLLDAVRICQLTDS